MYYREGRRGLGWLLLLVFLAGVAVTTAFFVLSSPSKASNLSPGQGAGTQVFTGKAAAANLPPGLGPEAIADIVEAASPAVVRIDTVVGGGNLPSPFNDPFFRQFFGLPLPRQQETALGSGFIISPDGYILTNEHVVEGAREVKVTIVGFDQPFKAKVVGADRDLDLAVLKVEAGKPLPYLKLGDADKARVGEWVIAIGNPYGLDHTVTVGVLSAKGRPIDTQDRHYENLLQTDASINPGNSGGPLLNLKGEVIGINTAVKVDAQGVGFAIPSTTVQPVLNDLMTKGKIVRPWLGVVLQEVTPDIADFLGMSKPEGVLVREVVPEGPAAKAGLKRGDIILQVDGQPVNSASELVKLIQKKQVGQTMQLLVFRRGSRLSLTVTLAEKPSQF
ncbi:Do/DeqQ family serine protease [Thermanaeromonas toyohensis ToBE]|uniref:Do/DeqQ family serine protease n=1 Tax=Thermanaeromonas toyohensis ToBE TaxID=698762 RepID=A0A1W1VLE5_9FIRM|nr:trypsin-like peptidase domain-containing protein [Thermanaeromonas toyohensis]SMB93784.1 Do/DeqQ family serine protease [Thermanaeromonas toyohensis ToBE]